MDFISLLIAIALAMAPGTSQPAAKAPGDGAPQPKAAKKGKTLKVVDSRYGPIVFDGKGRVLYLFTKEKTKKSRCYGDCAAAWPPFITPKKPKAGAGTDASLLGTTKRKNGKLQVTYNGHPLYYYVADRQPGMITCQDIDEFGGTWLVVDPEGNAVR